MREYTAAAVIPKRHSLICVGIVLFPALACANSGTPLMWASALHLVFGNALIGLAEGTMLALVFKLRKRFSIPVMVAANYASAWFGVLILERLPRPDLHLYNAWRWVWMMVGVTFFLTLLVELPFVALCLRRSNVRFTRWLPIGICVQILSYAVIFTWYFLASPLSLYTRMEVVPVTKIDGNAEAVIYYISPCDGDVYSMRANGTDQQKRYALASRHPDDRLVSTQQEGRWILWACLNEGREDTTWFPLATNQQTRLVDTPVTEFRHPNAEGNWFNFGPVLSLSAATAWEVESGFWPTEGLSGRNVRSGEQFHVAFETPFLSWTIRNATLLPTDQIVFQLGRDQVCLLDPDKKQIGMLVRGRGPVVAFVTQEHSGTTKD